MTASHLPPTDDMAMAPSPTKPLRVLHLGSPTGLYGAERWILALVKNLPAADVESIVAVIQDEPGEEPALCRQAQALGARTQVFEAPGRLSLSAVGQLRAFIRDNDIDLLHTHFYKTDILGCFATRGTHCRIMTTPHGWSTNAGMKLRVYESLDRIAFRFHDAVVPLSEDLHRELEPLPGLRGKLHLIRNGVDLSEIDSVTSISPALEAYRAGDDFVVGYIGQLIARKRVDTLIRAFAALARREKRLCIVGEGDARPELERLAAELGVAERVTFYGYRPDRLELLKGFDVFVLPSLLEGIPRCVMESMAAGVAVVGSDIPGTRDIVEDGVTGLLFEPGSADELESKLAALAAEPGLAAKLSQAAETRVRAEYSAATMARRYTELYRRLCPEGERAVAARRDRVAAGVGRR